MMTAHKPRIRLHTDGTVSRRVATHDGWAWVKVSGDGLNELGALTTRSGVPTSPGHVSSQNLPAPDRSRAGLSGGDAGGNSAVPDPVSGLEVPAFLRRHDGLSASDRIALNLARAAA